MTKIIGSILLIFTFIISLVGCEKKIETGSISGFDENEEYISMWVHTIENTPEGEAYKKSVELFNKKYDGKYFLDIEFIPRKENGGGYSDKINAGVLSGGLPDIITVDGCKIVDEDFNMILRFVLRYAQSFNLPFYKKKIHEGFLRYLIVRRSETTGDLLINIVTTTKRDFDFTELANYLVDLGTKGKIAGILHTYSDTLADAVKPDSTRVLYGKDAFTETILGLQFNISPYSFFQTNTKGAELLYKTALDMPQDITSKVVFDLYSGTGTIAQIMATKAKEVYGIEIVEEAVEKAKEQIKNGELKPTDGLSK